MFRPFLRFDTGCASYVLGCGGLGRCAVVDPRADDLEAYVAFAESKGMRITHVIDTHVHADHASGGPELARRTGARYCLHERADVAHAFEPLRDGDDIELGNTRIHVMHTPGHTPESVSLLVVDLRRGPEPWFVLTGDTLFSGAVGRPDLPGDARESARELHASLERLLALPDDLEVWPAHFAGSACGAGLSGKPCSTIGFERRWSPLLALDRDAFVASVTDVPEKPAEMAAHLRANRGAG
ncbi:MBL fold metallo-hydrolase [Sandaracinus amylolyticus]|uniref:MBL fold metallo-hydrolase n=1 Tax=Sandaracinus amylolyticus TaxID=927083 RepID=UPI00069EAACA